MLNRPLYFVYYNNFVSVARNGINVEHFDLLLFPSFLRILFMSAFCFSISTERYALNRVYSWRFHVAHCKIVLYDRMWMMMIFEPAIQKKPHPLYDSQYCIHIVPPVLQH